MNNRICYIPIKGIDDRIADELSSKGLLDVNKYFIAAIRGLYATENNGKDINTSEEVIAYYKELKDRDRKKDSTFKKLTDDVGKFLSNPINAFEQLEDVMSLQTKKNRINMLYNMISSTATFISNRYKISREEAYKGIKDADGHIIGGTEMLFQLVFRKIQELRMQAANAGNKYAVEEFTKVLQNKEALAVLTSSIINHKEGIKISSDLSFSGLNDLSSLLEDDQLRDIEESTKESWQEDKANVSAYNTASKEVRKTLSNLPETIATDKGFKYKKDDLGFTISLNPMVVHQKLLNAFRGISNSETMMSELENLAKSDPNFATLYNILQKDSSLRTKFFVAYAKDWQNYSMLSINSTTGKQVVKGLNILTEKEAERRYRSMLSTQSLSVDKNSTIFYYGDDLSETGIYVNKGNVENLISILNDYKDKLNAPTQIPDSSNIFQRLATKNNNKVTASTRAIVYLQLFNALGIKTDASNILSIAKNRKLYTVIDKTIVDEEGFITILEKIKNNNTDGFLASYNMSVGKKKSKPFQERIGKIFKIIISVDPKIITQNRQRYNGKNYFCNVASSYLGRFIENVRTIVRAGNKKALQEFLLGEFGDNPIYYDKDAERFRNKWMQDLYNSNLNDPNSFANIIDFSRILGDDIQNAEDFTEGKHASLNLSMYFSGTNKVIRTPMFILGDSGVLKDISSPRYTIKELEDAYYDVFIQEFLFNIHIKNIKDVLKREPGSLKNINTSEYHYLPWLNIPKYNNLLDSDNIKDSFIKALHAYMEDSLVGYKDYLNSLQVRLDNILPLNDQDKLLEEYYWNHEFGQVMQMQLLTVSPGFYEGSTDLQKRFKEVHASGDRLDLTAVDKSGNKVIDPDSPYQTTLYFNDVVEDPSNTHADFMKVIENLYKDNPDIIKTYKEKTSSTDGQAYRTLDSYRAIMIASGRWNLNGKEEEAYDRIKQIQEEVKEGEITEEQSKILSDLMVVFQPIKPFLFTHEKICDIAIPVQLKCAEVVVIPELLPKGSRLRDMMKYAERNDIHVVCATSAVKVGNFGAIDIKDCKNSESLNNKLFEAFVHELDYKDYVIQNNVPEHIRESRLFGTQGRKINFSGLNPNKDYSHYTEGNSFNIGIGREKSKPNAYNLNSLYVSCIAANILEDLDKVVEELSDVEKVRKIIADAVLHTDRLSSNIFRYVGPYKTEDQVIEDAFAIPLYEQGVSKEIIGLVLSRVRKRIIQQKIHGGSAVQASAYGIRGYEESKNLQYVLDPKNNNNILYAECEMAFDLAYKDSLGRDIQLNFDDWCNPDGTLKLSTTEDTKGEYLSYKGKDGKCYIPKIELQYPGILTVIAYRIPTEEKYSSMSLRIVRFTRKVDGGGIIRVPNPGTTIAGFDYDIDKLYLLRKEHRLLELSKSDIKRAWDDFYISHPELNAELERLKEEDEENRVFLRNLGFNDEVLKEVPKYMLKEGTRELFAEWFKGKELKYSKFDEYDYSKTPWKQSRTARNNQILKLLQKRLEDYDTIKERTTPGGFSNAIKAMKKINTLKGIDLDNYIYSNPITILKYNQQNQVAGKLIGTFANHNAHHNMMSFCAKFEFSDPIAFGSHPEGLYNLKNPDALMKELLAASVDAVKQPVLNYLNFNTITSDSAATLCRLGYDFYEIGLLFNQPIIIELCNYCFNNNIRNVSLAAKHLKRRYKLPNLKDRGAFDSSVKSLEKSINDFQIEGSSHQAHILDLFLDIYGKSKDLSRAIMATKFTASNSLGSTIGSLYDIMYSAEDFTSEKSSLEVEFYNKDSNTTKLINLGLNVDNRDEYYSEIRNNPFGYEQVTYDSIMKVRKVISKYFPQAKDTYSPLLDFFRNLYNYLDAKSYDRILDYILPYKLSNLDSSPFNPNETHELEDGTIISNKQYYIEAFPKELFNYLKNHPEVKEEFLIFYYANPIMESDNSPIEISIGETGSFDSNTSDLIRESWEMAFNSSNPVVKSLATNLYYYSYYKSGLGFGSKGFNHLAPAGLKLSINVDRDTSYIEFLQEHLNSDQILDPYSFYCAFTDTYREDSNIVYHVNNSQFEKLQSRVVNIKGIFAEEIILGKDDSDFYEAKDGNYIFKPAILIADNLYIATNDGNPNEQFNLSHNGRKTYRLIDADLKKTTPVVDSSSSISPTSTETSELTEREVLSLMQKALNSGADASKVIDVTGQILDNIQKERFDVAKKGIKELIQEYLPDGEPYDATGEKICKK